MQLVESNATYRKHFCKLWSIPGGSGGGDTLLKIKLTRPVVRNIDYEGCYRANKVRFKMYSL